MKAAIAPLQEPALLLADGLFLLAHDELDCKPRLPPSVLSVGLAGALLPELALAEKVSLRDEAVVVTDPEPPTDALSGAVHQRLLRSVAPRPVRDWLLYFADDVLEQVAGRLAQVGRLIAQPSTLIRGVRCEFADDRGGTEIAVWLRAKVTRCEPLDAATAMLAGLVGAIGLEHPGLVELRNDERPRRHLQQSLQVLHPPTLPALILATRAVAQAVAVTSRT